MDIILLLMWVTKCLNVISKIPFFPSEDVKIKLHQCKTEAKKYDKWSVVMRISSRRMAHMCISCERMSYGCPGWSCEFVEQKYVDES